MSFPATLWLIGCGNMGGAMLRRWIDAGADAASLTVVDPGAPQVPSGVRVLAEAPDEPVPEAVLLAVKPQMRDAVAASLASKVAGTRLLLSILAGVDGVALAARFDARTIIRAMPNLPVSLGRGVVALHGGADDQQARATAETLMAPLGLVEWLDDEQLFHAVTALSGSGPGFVYRFIEALAEGGAALGLPSKQALRFAIATVEGSAALADASGELPEALANRVASPGGTTRAGLDVLDHDEAMKRLVAETLAAAARRSAELAEAAR